VALVGEDQSIQFDHAEFRETPALPCSSCKQAIQDRYHEINRKIVCSACRRRVEGAMAKGSRIGRFFRAVIFGLLAGALGTSIYFAVFALTGYQVGLISVLVGLLVGLAVRAGGRGRGGWPYQTLAIVLTYSSIVSAFTPIVYTKILASGSPNDALHQALQSAPSAVQTLTRCVAYVLALAFSFLVPFLGGFKNIIGLLIIAFGLYQAWKINKPTTIAGPFAIGVQKANAASSLASEV
jgi:hypothetical protein